MDIKAKREEYKAERQKVKDEKGTKRRMCK